MKWQHSYIDLIDRNYDPISDLRREKPPRPLGKPHPCTHWEIKMECVRVHPAALDDPSVLFVHPVAWLPATYNSSGDTEATRHIKILISTKNLNAVTDIFYHGESEPTTYSPASKTMNGPYALNLWRLLVGRVPSRDCYIAEESWCSVVVRAKVDGVDAITYCKIVNGPAGLGFPFGCIPVALYYQGQWRLLAYSGPEDCGGCGGGVNEGCTLRTNMGVSQVASLLITILRTGRTAIRTSIKHRDEKWVQISGKKQAEDSKFMSGYYEKAYAAYDVVEDRDEIGRVVKINGVYNLLVSAEPSRNSVVYHDIHDGDMDWLNGQVSDEIESGFTRNGAVKDRDGITCEADGM